MIPDLKPELDELIRNISTKNMYSGNKIPSSIMKLITIEETELNTGVLAPYWLGVLQKGRGPRKSNKDHGLVNIIFRWMAKRNLFKSTTPEGKLREAKSLTWYINKYGNKHFRSKVFLDIYEAERRKVIEKIEQKFSTAINKITMDIL